MASINGNRTGEDEKKGPTSKIQEYPFNTGILSKFFKLSFRGLKIAQQAYCSSLWTLLGQIVIESVVWNLLHHQINIKKIILLSCNQRCNCTAERGAHTHISTVTHIFHFCLFPTWKCRLFEYTLNIFSIRNSGMFINKIIFMND